MNELISVIIPIYNVLPYLDQCMESVINQTYKNLEIIMVDDGSTDGCREACDLWKTKDNRIKVVHKSNGGLSDARNAGVQVATGDLIGYVDSDDWIDLTMYEKLYRAMVENDTQVSLCQFTDAIDGQIQPIDHTGKVMIFTGKELVDRILSNEQNPRVSNSVWKFLYKREAIKSIEFEKGRLYEDALYTMPVCFGLERIAFVDEPLYYYRQRSDSIMGIRISDRHVNDMIHYQTGLKEFFIKNNGPKELALQHRNYSKMLLEFRYLCSKDKAFYKLYDLLTEEIKNEEIRPCDVPDFSTIKYTLYRYAPKLLVRIKN